VSEPLFEIVIDPNIPPGRGIELLASWLRDLDRKHHSDGAVPATPRADSVKEPLEVHPGCD
jgi:hypothetical protein